MVLLESEKINIGEPVHHFSLVGVDGQAYSLENFKNSKAFVVVFMCNHCPYVQAIWGRLVALQQRFMEKGVKFAGINPNFNPDYPEDSFDKMKEYSEKYSMNFPYLQDTTQEVAKRFGAVCTPDIFVYDSEMKLAYHGRVDDSWQDESAVETHELADALEALVSGEMPAENQKPSMGCSIKWL